MRRKAAEHRRDFPIRPWAWQGLIAQGIAPEREVVLEHVFCILSDKYFKHPETFQKSRWTQEIQGLRATVLHHKQSRVRH